MRRRTRIKNRVNRQKFTVIEYDLVLFNTFLNDGSGNNANTNNIYSLYLRFRPTTDNGATSTNKSLFLNNTTTNPQATVIDSIPLGEEDAWKELYSLTKIRKIIVRYDPTCKSATLPIFLNDGTTLQAGIGAATMWTVPAYYNIDDFITTSNAVQFDNSDAIDYEQFAKKPYAKHHRIDRPWTRIIKPKVWELPRMYDNGGTGTEMLIGKNCPWIDLDRGQATNIHLDGLQIFMKGITLRQNNNTFTFPESTDTINGTINLGRMTFTFYQDFKATT